MTFQLPPIAKTAERLLLEIEQAVAGFPRKHRYTAGEELRKQAMGVTVLVHRAWRDRRQQRALWAVLRPRDLVRKYGIAQATASALLQKSRPA